MVFRFSTELPLVQTAESPEAPAFVQQEPKMSTRFLLYTRATGAKFQYEVEANKMEQQYRIRRGGTLLRVGAAACSTWLTSDMLLSLACADIEELVGMNE